MTIPTWKSSVVLTLCVVLCGGSQAQSFRLSECLKRAQALIAENPNALAYGDDRLLRYLWCLSRDVDDPVPRGLNKFLAKLADDIANAPNVRCEALVGLRRFNTQDNRNRMHRYLSVAGCLQIKAAGSLVYWGLWEEGAPTLASRGEFKPLIVADSARARPVLVQSLLADNPEVQLSAARWLHRYDDTTSIVSVTREILSDYAGHLKPTEDMGSVRRACWESAFSAVRRADSSVVPDLVTGLSYPDEHLRQIFLSHLASFMFQQNAAAKAAIVNSMTSSPYADIRSRCAYYLEMYNLKH